VGARPGRLFRRIRHRLIGRGRGEPHLSRRAAAAARPPEPDRAACWRHRRPRPPGGMEQRRTKQ
jgi:hypothetical protein